MKLKKAYIYILSFVSITVLYTACYYISYRHALNEFNKKAVERSDEFLTLQNKPTPLPKNNDNENSVTVGTKANETILPSTRYILQTYNMKTGTIDTQELNPPGYLVGLTKDEVNNYLMNYMKDMTLSEYNKGLISYELLSFSDKQIVFRKSYDEDFLPFRFYVVVKDGYVVVYNSDLKSVYSYTHIEAKTLPEEDRISLSQGIYVNSLEDLYGLLESFSS